MPTHPWRRGFVRSKSSVAPVVEKCDYVSRANANVAQYLLKASAAAASGRFD